MKNKTVSPSNRSNTSSRSATRQETLARIMRAAEESFATNGFSGTSMDSIALEAKLSKQNLIYYFSSKEILYQAVLENVLNLWVEKLSLIEAPDATPLEAMSQYLRQKIELSRDYPAASKVFAHEIINGAPKLKKYLSTNVKPQFERDVALINTWIKKGVVKPVSAEHLFFTLWASTQTCADFATQTELLLGKSKLDEEYFEQTYEFLYQSLIEPFFA